jgi:APA family basic amino acid/polyamine antiporter
MAANGLFFRKVSEIHGRYHTPAFAILLQSAWAITLILFWGTFENLISYVVFINWIFLATTVSGIFLFRRRLPGAERPYRTVGYPITPLFFVAVSIWFVLNTLLSKPEQAIAGLILLALGLPVYYYWRNEHLHPRLKN